MTDPGRRAMFDGADEYRDSRPPQDALPAEFETWSRAQQADFVDSEFLRASLLRRVLQLSGYPTEDLELTTDSKVTGEMLAAVYCELRGFDHD